MVFYNDETVTPTSNSTTGDETNELGEQMASATESNSSATLNDSNICNNNNEVEANESESKADNNISSSDTMPSDANNGSNTINAGNAGNIGIANNDICNPSFVSANDDINTDSCNIVNNGTIVADNSDRNNCGVIFEVWQNNIKDAFDKISEIVDEYSFVAIDTEFPGVVVRPTSNFHEYYYQTVRFNVDLLKVIQIGLSFRNKYGKAPINTYSTFQFNFKFDMENDIYSQESIQFLRHSGIEFDKHHNNGIDFMCFGEYMYGSGLILNPKVKWISFHGCYDFAYLVKILSSKPLPESESNFFETVKMLFPTLYDIKFILKQIQNLNHLNSLQKLSEHLEIQRIGIAHQAGSDALVTCCTFFKLIRNYLDSCIDDNLFNGQIYGFGNSVSISK
ncbi:hypothetical protein FG379_000761 [Cryptosporidium bovis]|uniref:uncharacterized protein n=1 Tax=Cryptosporidium bovis TaxID=310047 RepID=UPI00351A665B|nr:hypothetical protein FG379_000761 [Cryptosporidium bovis]